MKIHILSDLHTEFSTYIPSPVVQDVDLVIPAGDIAVKGRGVTWLRNVCYIGLWQSQIVQEAHYNTFEKMHAVSYERVRMFDNDVQVESEYAHR